MATVSKGRTFVSGETVTPAKLNELVDSATVTSIVDADVSASAAIALSKLATGALPTAITVASDNLVDGTIVNADINASAAIAGSKLADGGITAAKLDGAQTGSAPIYGCRAWVSFVGTAGSTVDGEFRCTINGSGNVTKVVRNSTGTFTIHLTTAMPTANYAVTMSYQIASGANTGRATATTTNQITLAFSDNAGAQNPTLCGVAIFG